MSQPRVLSIAGSDPSGGAGIQADLKTFSALGAYGMAAITSLTAQNTQGVSAVHIPDADFLTRQLDAVQEDIVIDAVKIGMLANAANIYAVKTWLESANIPVVVVDPVMISTSGHQLLEPDAIQALRELLHLATILTPNLPELAYLLDTKTAGDEKEMIDQARQLSTLSGTYVLAKGGHLTANFAAFDVLSPPDGNSHEIIESPRIHTKNTHGTGCTLSSALAALQPRYNNWTDTVRAAKDWLTKAIKTADELQVGHGNGPVNHSHSMY